MGNDSVQMNYLEVSFIISKNGLRELSPFFGFLFFFSGTIVTLVRSYHLELNV